MEQLEQIASDVRHDAKLRGLFDPYALLIAADLDVRCRPGIRPSITDRTVWVRSEDPPERQRFAAVHELSHVLLDGHEVENNEWNTNWLASALIHDRSVFLDRLQARRGDLAALRSDFRWSSFEALGRRVVNLMPSVLWVCDRGLGGRSQRRSCSPGVSAKLAKPTALERELVARAARKLEPQRSGDVRAWPLRARGGRHLRVVSLAPAAALL